MKKLLLLLLLSSVVCPLSSLQAAVSSAPGGSAFGSVVVSLPVNSASALSNTLWNLPNNSTLILGPGTYTNDCFNAGVASGIDTTSTAPLQFRSKTNVAIIGAGRDITRIFSSVTNWSSLLFVSNCNNIRFSGITFEGTRMADPQLFVRAVYAAMVNLGGNNSYVEFDHCGFKNYMGQGFFDFTTENHTNKFFSVHDNYAYGIGTTNGNTVTPGTKDGTAFCLYPDSTYERNVVENSNRAFEWESAQAPGFGHGVIVRGNVIDNVWGIALFALADANLGASTPTFSGQMLIEGNQISGTNVSNFLGNDAGIVLEGGSSYLVADNQIYGFTSGILLESSAGLTNTERVLIKNNTIAGCYTPLAVNINLNQTFFTRDFTIEGNMFLDCPGSMDIGCSNIRLANNEFVNSGTSAGIGIWLKGGTTNFTNMVVQGNSFYNLSGTTASGVRVDVPVRNVVIKDNWFGPGITAPILYESDGELDLVIDKQSTSASPVTLLSINMKTNSAALCRMEAIGISSTAFDACDLSLAATFRNTNGFVSNIVANAIHTFIYTNRTDATWYIDATNTGTKVINFVAAGAAGKTVNWRIRCKAILIGN